MVRSVFVGHNNKGRQRVYIDSHYLDNIDINAVIINVHLCSHSEQFLFEGRLWQLVYLRTGLLPQWESSFGSLAISILRPLQGEEPPSWTRYIVIMLSAAIPINLCVMAGRSEESYELALLLVK
jgi:hypothetical protein